MRLWLMLACVGMTVLVTAQSPEARPPNIVLVIAEDLGWTDAAFAGSRFYETPHLDALATNGLRCTSFYATPEGLPTLASIATGQYSPRHGVLAEPPRAGPEPPGRKLDPPERRTTLPPSIPTVAETLKRAGYVTGFLGHWRLGRDPQDHPLQRGFDESTQVSERYLGFETDPKAEVPATTYLTDFLTDQAIDFLTRHKDQPFFLQLSHLAVRAPLEPKPGFIGRFEKKPPAGGHRDAAYAAMIASLDESFGRLVAKLDELQLGPRTLLIFLSSNGGVGGYPAPDGGGRRVGFTDNAPLRGGKGMAYEGGLRVPFLARWPGVIPPGSRTVQPCTVVDLFPTFCAVAAVKPPDGHPLDGESLLPLLRDPSLHLGRDALYWHLPTYLDAGNRTGGGSAPCGVIRAGNFKLLEFFEDGRLELYNLVEDLGEKDNLVRSLPEKTAELRGKLTAWRLEVKAPMPTPRPPPTPPTAAPTPTPTPTAAPNTNATVPAPASRPAPSPPAAVTAAPAPPAAAPASTNSPAPAPTPVPTPSPSPAPPAQPATAPPRP